MALEGSCLKSALAVALLGVALAVPVRCGAQALGTDITNLNLCLYGDCEARGAYAADPWGWANPGTMPAMVLDYMPRGTLLSMGYFHLNAGGVSADVVSSGAALTLSPVVLLVSPVYGEASGRARELSGLDLDMWLRSVRLAAAVDLERAIGIPGLSVGLLGEVPGTTTDLRIRLGDLVVARGTEHHEVNLTLGAHWRAGRDRWFMAGGFVNAIRNSMTTEILGLAQHGTTNAWFARVGLSLLPFVPLGVADGPSPLAEWLHEVRLAGDGEHRNLSVPGDGTRTQWIGYFGADLRLLPDAWNPLARWVRFTLISGIDTERGWGLGGGIIGNGPLEAFSCNPGYSSRALAPVLGRRTNVWAATCSVALPF